MDKMLTILAFLDVGLKALERVQWLAQREGDELTADEKAQINAELAAARERFQAELAKLTT